MTALSQASLRINESTDVDTALRAVMDSARSLTPRSPPSTRRADLEDHLVLGLNSDDVERLWQAP